MANEQQYYNPIIQAMAQSVQAQQNQQKLEQEQERQKQEIASSKLQGAQSQQAHDLAERSQKYYEQHSDKLLDLKAAMDKANQQLINAQIGHTVHDMIMHGATPEETQSLAPGIGQLPSREDVGQFNQAQTAGTAGATTQAQQNVLFPQQQQLQQNLFEQQKSLKDYQNDFELKKQSNQITSNEKIAKLSKDAAYGIAAMHDKTTRMMGGMDEGEGASSLINNMVDLAASGQVKLNPANKMEAFALSRMADAGFKNPDPKDIAAMKASQKLIPIFDKLREYANTLPDDRTAATAQGYLLHGKQALGIGSKQQTDLDNVLAQASTVGTSLENITGRPLAGQLKLELNSLVQPGNTKADVLSKINNLQNTYVNNQENVTQGGMNAIQKELLYRKQGILPSSLATAPQKGPKGTPLDIPASLRLGQPAYPEPQGPPNAPVQ